MAEIACEHAAACPGCPLLGQPYEAQLVHKRRAVERAFARYPALASVAVAATRGAARVVEYRTRAKLVVGAGARLGLYAAGGQHEVVDVPGCRVLSPTLSRVAAVVRARVAADEASGGPMAPRRGDAGGLRAIDLREIRSADGAPGALLTLVVERGPSFRLEAAREAARAIAAAAPAVVAIGVNFHDGARPQILGDETVRVFGDGAAAFGAFTQAHADQAAAIAARVEEALVAGRAAGTPAPRVLDLYGGSGAFALGLAARGADVVLVESFAPAAARAEAEAARRGLRVKAIAEDATRALEALARRGEAFDAAVVNPPRRGVHPSARRALARLGPAAIAYVSCDPETLARDVDHLARLGYRAREVTPFDMIPLTAHVEALTILARGEAPPPRVLYEDGEVVAVAKDPHEPTTPQGEHEGSLTARVRAIAGEAASPIHRLDVGTSGVVFFARAPRHVAAWSRALAADDAEKVYLAATRGVPPPSGTIDQAIREEGRALAAVTRFRRVATLGPHALVEARPQQGRRHQIRIHLAGVGHPLLGDGRYGHAATNRHLEEKYGLDRAFLHCTRVELTHPGTGTRLVVEARLAGDLSSVQARLERAAAKTKDDFWEDGRAFE